MTNIEQKLSSDQIEFLKKYRIDPSEIFDATGMRQSRYKEAMQITGQHFAIGVTPCKTSGHTIRTKYGHCVQCKPDKISYMKRHSESAYVYIAHSTSQQLIKVGVTTQLQERLENLNWERYGQATDWKILAVAQVDEAGKIENQVHQKLHAYRHSSTSIRADQEIVCYELFRCSFAQAKTALISVLPSGVVLKTIGEAKN